MHIRHRDWLNDCLIAICYFCGMFSGTTNYVLYEFAAAAARAYMRVFARVCVIHIYCVLHANMHLLLLFRMSRARWQPLHSMCSYF